MKRIILIIVMIATTAAAGVTPRSSAIEARSQFGPCQNSCLAISEEYFWLCVQMGYPGEACLQQAADSYERCNANCPPDQF